MVAILSGCKTIPTPTLAATFSPTEIPTLAPTPTKRIEPTQALTPTLVSTPSPVPTERPVVVPGTGDFIVRTDNQNFFTIKPDGIFPLEAYMANELFQKNRSNCTPHNSCVTIDPDGKLLLLSRSDSAPRQLGYPELRGTRFIEGMYAISYALRGHPNHQQWDLGWKYEIGYVVAAASDGHGNKVISLHESPETHHQATIFFGFGKTNIIKVMFDENYPMFLVKNDNEKYQLFRLIPGIQQALTDTQEANCSRKWALSECLMRENRKTIRSLQLVPIPFPDDWLIENMEIIRQ